MRNPSTPKRGKAAFKPPAPINQRRGPVHSSEEFANFTGVSRETLEDYVHWHALLVKWNARINLVSKGDLSEFWSRHALDSWQICRFLKFTENDKIMVNKTPLIVDFGSGGGFPAIAAAIHCKHQGCGHVVMIESAGKKASFLKTVIRELDLPAEARVERIENLEPLSADFITARAFAPLDRLLGYAAPHQHSGTQYILPKGANVDEELETAARTWTFDLETATSVSDTMATILQLSNVKPISP